MGRMTTAKLHHAFSEPVYWALVELKDEGRFRSVDEAVRPLLGLPPGQKHPCKKGFEVEENGIYQQTVEQCHPHRKNTAT